MIIRTRDLPPDQVFHVSVDLLDEAALCSKGTKPVRRGRR
jgi:hypothetical protein